jgi:hypothetical protein
MEKIRDEEESLKKRKDDVRLADFSGRRWRLMRGRQMQTKVKDIETELGKKRQEYNQIQEHITQAAYVPPALFVFYCTKSTRWADKRRRSSTRNLALSSTLSSKLVPTSVRARGTPDSVRL